MLAFIVATRITVGGPILPPPTPPGEDDKNIGVGNRTGPPTELLLLANPCLMIGFRTMVNVVLGPIPIFGCSMMVSAMWQIIIT